MMGIGLDMGTQQRSPPLVGLTVLGVSGQVSGWLPTVCKATTGRCSGGQGWAISGVALPILVSQERLL